MLQRLAYQLDLRSMHTYAWKLEAAVETCSPCCRRSKWLIRPDNVRPAEIYDVSSAGVIPPGDVTVPADYSITTILMGVCRLNGRSATLGVYSPYSTLRSTGYYQTSNVA